MVEVQESFGEDDSVEKLDVLSSTRRETLAAVNDFVVLAVKNTVSGVTGISGKMAVP
jgi:hypothetical protein